MVRPLLALFLLSGSCFVSTEPPKPGCGYQSCNKEKPGMINVHLVAHTHNDPGWIVTVDQYYYRYVQWILGSVIPALEENPSRRFIYVEMSFFSRWWADDIGEDMRNRVRKLVNEGRLEFILGGWVMNDEAATHYTAIIDQHKRGFEFLRETFGECGRTKIGWQIDPFGHSREQASFFAQFGFDGLFFGRLDEQDKDFRKQKRTMEMLWEGSPKNLGPPASLFTGVLPQNYDWLPYFRYDVSSVFTDDQTEKQYFVNDNPKLHDYNVDTAVQKFIEQIMKYRKWYITDHVVATMGTDFNYVDAQFNFKQIDKIMHYVNEKQRTNGSRVNVLYSTPSCYLKAVHGEERTWTTKQDDFFPYANQDHSYWTGYFTSRPAQKYFTRYANAYHQAVKKLAALAKVEDSKGSLYKLEALENSISLGQHHDAITGTERQVVAFDYAERISEAMGTSEGVIQEAYSKIIPKTAATALPEQILCHYRNVSVCSTSQKASGFEVTVFNAHASARNVVVRIPVDGTKYQVFAQDGRTAIPSDIVPVMPSVEGIRPKDMKPAKNELVFAVNTEGLGFKTFFVQQKKSSSLEYEPEKRALRENDADIFIEGEFYRVDFDQNGNIKSINSKKQGVTVSFSQSFSFYKSFQGDNHQPKNQSSGAYIFRPIPGKSVPVKLTKWQGLYKGQVVQEARQQFSDWITQVVRIFKNGTAIEMEWTVGPIPIGDGIGKEVITRYNIPEFGNNGTFYTDSNGREMLERRLNYRATWPAKIDEPVAGNYYPVNTAFHIKSGDGKYSFVVLPDRAQGGSSLKDGDIELMLHRRLLHDDNYGVNQALNETGLNGKGLVVRGIHRLVFGKTDQIAGIFRKGAQETFQQPLVTFSHSALAPADYVNKFNTKYSGLTNERDVPEQVNILSFEKFRSSPPTPSPEGTVPYLVRFEHFFEKDEDANMSKPVVFDVKGVFRGFTIHSLQELSLGANAAVESIQRLVWQSERGQTPSGLATAVNGTVVHLNPMQIATIQVNFKV